jgi:hypothetical protein
MKVKRTGGIFYSALGKNIPYSRVFLIALLFVLVAIFVLSILESSYERYCRGRILVLQVNFKTMRTAIEMYYKENAQFPASIMDIRTYIASDKMYVDLTSDKQSNVPEYRELNDKGGYYYDPNTGDVRLNLTRPVREYLKFYSGSYKDQVPSSW